MRERSFASECACSRVCACKCLYVAVGHISFLLFWIKINSMPSRDRDPGTPVCRCGERYLTELRGTRLLEKWADEVGIKWGWANSGKAMWYLRHRCHRIAFEEDHRVQNGSSSPGVSRWGLATSGTDRGAAQRLVCGDFYLRNAPPEYMEPAARGTQTAPPRQQQRRERKHRGCAREHRGDTR